MTHTALLKVILEKAEAVQNEFHCDCLWPSHIAVAFADFCATEYTGFSVSDTYIHPNWYEEERLRLLYDKVVKYRSFFRLLLSKKIRGGYTEEPFQFALCEQTAALRNHNVLSADLVFLCVSKELTQEYGPVYRTAVSEETIIPLLEYADDNIYDYTVKSVEAICRKLMEKANTAAAKRDWKPAAKFAEPEMLVELALAGIETTHAANITTVKIPKFFANTCLTLSIHRANGIYYVHDNRFALRYLSRTLRDAIKFDRAVKKVCHRHRMDNGRITGSFSNVTGFMDYLKDLIFVAHADLYYPKAKNQLCFKDKGYVYLSADQAEPFDEAELITMLKESMGAYYDEDIGLCCWLNASNFPFPTRYAFLVETLDDGCIRFSDKLKGKYEGELLESCYWYHESTDISVYHKFFSKLAGRFGGEFDGQNIYLTAKPKDFRHGLFQFFQIAVLVSRLGHDIALPSRSRTITQRKRRDFR